MIETRLAGSPTTAFISHHSSQYASAKRVKAALARAGIDGWLAPDDIEPGTHFDVAIVEQLERSDVIILLLDSRADRSKHVKRELMLADEGDKPIFPVRLEPVEASGLAYWLKEHQWIDWFGGEGDGLDRLVAAIDRRTGGARAVSQPVPPPPPQAEPAHPPAPPHADAPRGTNRKFLLGAGAVCALGLAVTVMVGAGPGDGTSVESSVSATPRSATDSAAAEKRVGESLKAAQAAVDKVEATGDGYVIEPGRWRMTRDVTDISFPPLAPEIKEQLSLTLENDPSPEDCVTEATARKPDVKLFDPRGENDCSLNDFEMARGKLSGIASCTLPDSGGQGKATFAFKGTYDRKQIAIENDVTMIQQGNLVKLRTRDRSRWVGRCE